MSRARRHHYVSKFLLTQFADKDDLLYFARKGFDEVKPIRPSNLFLERDLFSLDGEFINVSTDVEGMFSKIESRFAPIHRMIIETVRKREIPVLAVEDRMIIADFVIAQWKRTPALPVYRDDTAQKIIIAKLKAARKEVEATHEPLSSTERVLFEGDYISGLI